MNTKNLHSTKISAMTIAGSDSGAGAGIQADLLTFAHHKVYGCTAITAVTAQNPDGVTSVCAVDSNTIIKQIEAINDFYKPKAAKTGMLFDANIVEVVADFFQKNKEISLVVDPVMISTSGSKLLNDDAIISIKEKLIPLATVFTPNLDEACVLLNVSKIENIEDSAIALCEKFNTSVLLKGGHLDGDDIVDVLATKNGKIVKMLSKRIENVNTHGSGCTLSAAIASNLANNQSLEDACRNAQKYILSAMKNPVATCGGNFINHFPKQG